MKYVGERRLMPYLLLTPSIIIVALVSFVPLFYALRVSVSETTYLSIGAFNHFDHFKEFLSTNEGLSTIRRSWVLVFGTVLLSIPYAFVLALLLNRKFRWKMLRTTFRSILLMPYAISWLVTAFLWMWMINPNYGILGFISREFFGRVMVDLTKSANFAMPTLIFVTAWHMYPLAVLFILADLQNIPNELKEAASIDGASGWQLFYLIVFPLIRNTVLVVTVLLTLNTFNMVTLTLRFTGGGPGYGTMTLALSAFKQGFEYWRIGLASAISVIIFSFNVLLSLIYTKVLKSERYY